MRRTCRIDWFEQCSARLPFENHDSIEQMMPSWPFLSFAGIARTGSQGLRLAHSQPRTRRSSPRLPSHPTSATGTYTHEFRPYHRVEPPLRSGIRPSCTIVRPCGISRSASLCPSASTIAVIPRNVHYSAGFRRTPHHPIPAHREPLKTRTSLMLCGVQSLRHITSRGALRSILHCNNRLDARPVPNAARMPPHHHTVRIP